MKCSEWDERSDAQSAQVLMYSTFGIFVICHSQTVKKNHLENRLNHFKIVNAENVFS